MKTWGLLSTFVGAVMLVLPQSANADATAYVVHGIPGEDLGLPAELSVDVSVNGMCALPGFTFGEIVGPLSLPAGMYDIAIGLADPMMPCSAEPVIDANGVMLADGVNYSIVAYLTMDGMPTAGVFENDVSGGRGSVTINLFHTAAAPGVDVTLKRGKGRAPASLVVEEFVNGEQAIADVRPGFYMVSIAPAGDDRPVFGPAPFFAAPWRDAFLVYAVGSLENETFTLLVESAGEKIRGGLDGDDDDDDEDDGDDHDSGRDD